MIFIEGDVHLQRWRILMVTAALSVCSPFSVWAQEDGVQAAPPVPVVSAALVPDDEAEIPAANMISLRDALRLAYINNPTLRAARARTKAVFEKMPQAYAGYLPTVLASGEIIRSRLKTVPGTTENDTQRGAGLVLDQPLYRGGRTTSGMGAAEALVDAELAALASSERYVLFEAARAYMDVLRTKAILNVNQKNRAAIARQLKATRDRFKAGDVTRTDVAQAEFRLARAEADLTGATGALRTARAVFEQVVGVAPKRMALPGRTFSFPPTVDEATAAAQQFNPDVIAAKARHIAAKENVGVEFGVLLPDVSLSAAAASTRDPSDLQVDRMNAASVGVKLSVPLYEGGAVRSRVREAKYKANESYMLVLEAQRTARAEAARAWEEWTAARSELTSREVQVKSSEIARSGVRAEAEHGGRTILDVLDADLEVRDAQIALITAKRNQVVAEYALASSLGLLLPAHVGIMENVFDPDAFLQKTKSKIFSTAADLEQETE